ncbi:MAG: CopD family protein [Ignavibacteriae bacterium]|nr:CopD family protein [Ignavibacteriota bacterium]
MDFLLWSCRSMHIFGVIIWLGGLLFESAISVPIAQAEGEPADSLANKIHTRFVAFVWMSVWTIAVTGIIMMLLNPQFHWFTFQTQWQRLLGFKQLTFILMLFYAFGYARMLSYLNAPSSNDGTDENTTLVRQRLSQFRKINIALGITALLLAAGM